MAHPDRPLRARKPGAVASLIGTLAKAPVVERLPAQKRDHCKVLLDVGKTRFECDAYDDAARECEKILVGTNVKLICRIVVHRPAKGVLRPHPVIGFEVNKVKAYPRARR